MKVLFITPTLNPRSGWGRLALETVSHLRLQGCEVEVYSEGNEQRLPYPVYPLKPLASGFSIVTLLNNALRVRTKSKAFDLVHALDGWPWGIYAALAVLGTRKAFFMDGVGTYSVAPLYAFGKRSLMRLVYKRVQKVFCISRYVMDELVRARAPKNKLTVVNFGMHLFSPASEADMRAAKEKYRITPEHAPILLTVGAIKDRKGQLDVLKAVKILKATYPHILYLAAGSSNDQGYVSAMEEYARTHGLTDNLHIVVGADDKTLAALYTMTGVNILASTNDTAEHHFEGFGQVIIEGYQFGAPAVGSAECGIEDAIEDGVSGLLSRQRDPEDIAKKIQTVLERHSYFSAGALKAVERFSWQKTAATYKEYYSKFVC